MSFICDRCKKPQPRHISPTRVPVETRPKIYPPRENDPGGTGHEIVKEENLCSKCAKGVKK